MTNIPKTLNEKMKLFMRDKCIGHINKVET